MTCAHVNFEIQNTEYDMYPSQILNTKYKMQDIEYNMYPTQIWNKDYKKLFAPKVLLA